jgi:hypothetical protein
MVGGREECLENGYICVILGLDVMAYHDVGV